MAPSMASTPQLVDFRVTTSVAQSLSVVAVIMLMSPSPEEGPHPRTMDEVLHTLSQTSPVLFIRLAHFSRKVLHRVDHSMSVLRQVQKAHHTARISIVSLVIDELGSLGVIQDVLLCSWNCAALGVKVHAEALHSLLDIVL